VSAAVTASEAFSPYAQAISEEEQRSAARSSVKIRFFMEKVPSWFFLAIILMGSLYHILSI
jgi:hypothetical protein